MSSTKNPDQNIQWEELISKQEKSGLSQKEFCKQNNIRLPQLGYHRGLIKSKECIKKNQKLFSEVQIKQPTLNQRFPLNNSDIRDHTMTFLPTNNHRQQNIA